MKTSGQFRKVSFIVVSVKVEFSFMSQSCHWYLKSMRSVHTVGNFLVRDKVLLAKSVGQASGGKSDH